MANRERHTLSNGSPIHIFDHPIDDGGSYLQEVEACRRAFAQWPVFARMPESKRKRVTGWGRDTTGYFGRNGGAGNFKSVVRRAPESIGEHLDRVPLEGAVHRDLIEEVLTGLDEIRGVGLGVASRMLAVKRPVLFVTLNGANRPQVRAIFGTAPSSIRRYLDWHERIWTFPWFSSPEPAGSRDEARVWRARVALLDCLIYELAT